MRIDDIFEDGYYSEWNNGRKGTIYDYTNKPPMGNYESLDDSHRPNASVNNAAPKTLDYMEMTKV